MELSVTITNVKNQPPQWEKESYTVVIPENTVRDTPVVVHQKETALNIPLNIIMYKLAHRDVTTLYAKEIWCY